MASVTDDSSPAIPKDHFFMVSRKDDSETSALNVSISQEAVDTSSDCRYPKAVPETNDQQVIKSGELKETVDVMGEESGQEVTTTLDSTSPLPVEIVIHVTL